MVKVYRGILAGRFCPNSEQDWIASDPRCKAIASKRCIPSSRSHSGRWLRRCSQRCETPLRLSIGFRHWPSHGVHVALHQASRDHRSPAGYACRRELNSTPFPRHIVWGCLAFGRCRRPGSSQSHCVELGLFCDLLTPGCGECPGSSRHQRGGCVSTRPPCKGRSLFL